jgi:vancomycin resistance protein VanJ
LTALNLAFLIALWLAVTRIAEQRWLTTLLTYMPQQPFGIPAVILLLWALGRRERGPLFGNVVAMGFFAFALLGINAPLRTWPATAGTPIRVMSYNVYHAAAGVERIVAVVDREQPDLLCLQEVNAFRQWPDPLPELRRLLPGWHVAAHRELATLSRHPILSRRVHPLPAPSGRAILETQISVNGRRVTVINVHISTAGGPQSLARRLGSLPAYLRHTAEVRAAEVEDRLKLTGAAPPPLIIAGDFNTPPRGLVYRRMTGRFQDAFRAAGWGLGHTYPAHLPLLRIDYLFASPAIAVRTCAVRSVQGSDHRPVVAEVVLE